MQNNNNQQIDYSPIQNLIGKLTFTSSTNAREKRDNIVQALVDLKTFLNQQGLTICFEERTNPNNRQRQYCSLVVKDVEEAKRYIQDRTFYNTVNNLTTTALNSIENQSNTNRDNLKRVFSNLMTLLSGNQEITQEQQNELIQGIQTFRQNRGVVREIPENIAKKKHKDAIKDYVNLQLEKAFVFSYEGQTQILQNLQAAKEKFLEDSSKMTIQQKQAFFAQIDYIYGSVQEFFLDSLPNENTLQHRIHQEFNEQFGGKKEEIVKLYEEYLLEKFTKNQQFTQREKDAFLAKINEYFGENIANLDNQGYLQQLEQDGNDDRAAAKAFYEKIKTVENFSNKINTLPVTQVTVKPEDFKYQQTLKNAGVIEGFFNNAEGVNQAQLTAALGDIDSDVNGLLRGSFTQYPQRIDEESDDIVDNTNIDLITAQNDTFVTQTLFKYGELGEKMTGKKISDLQVDAPPQDNNITLEYDARGAHNVLLKSRQYDSSVMLEEDHVLGIIDRLLQKTINKKAEDFYIRTVYSNAAAGSQQAQQREERIRNALVHVMNKKTPAALCVSSGGHWITLTLLPDPNDSKKVLLGSMDSMESCSIGQGIATQLIQQGKNLDLTIEKQNLSVSGQQIGNCCGFATAVNTVSMIKTLNDMNDQHQSFPMKKDNNNVQQLDVEDVEKFKKENLLPNVFYRHDTIEIAEGKKHTGTVLYGNKPSNISCSDFVSQFGGMMLQKAASQDILLKYKNIQKTLIEVSNKTQTEICSVMMGIALELYHTNTKTFNETITLLEQTIVPSIKDKKNLEKAIKNLKSIHTELSGIQGDNIQQQVDTLKQKQVQKLGVDATTVAPLLKGIVNTSAVSLQSLKDCFANINVVPRHQLAAQQGLTVIDTSHPFYQMLKDEQVKKILCTVLKRKIENGGAQNVKEFTNQTELEKIVYFEEPVKQAIQDIVNIAVRENADATAQLSWWNAFLMWLSELPLIGRLVNAICGNKFTEALSAINELDQTLQQNYDKSQLLEPVLSFAAIERNRGANNQMVAAQS